RSDDAQEISGIHGQVDAVQHPHHAVVDRHALELDERTHQLWLRLASHQAPADAQEPPRRNPPRTSEGQWAWSTIRAIPTSTMSASTVTVRPSRCMRPQRSFTAK